MMTFDLSSENDSVQLAQKLAKCLTAGLTLGFTGEIGTGKTTFIRALLRALGIRGAVKSPTFSLVESYACPGFQLHHFDLYRIEDEAELEYIGFRDYFSPGAVCCIEWPERAPWYLSAMDLHFFLTMKESGRMMVVKALSDSGKQSLSGLQG